jgi:hypothetical protein
MEAEDIMLIAPCGMNCRVCRAHIREKNVCPGCRVIVSDKSKSRLKCVIKNCEHVLTKASGSCHDCDKLPCQRMKSLDKRYRAKYGMSMIENLEYIRKSGTRAFVKRENERWLCPECGAILCVHRESCPGCGRKWHEAGIVFQG